MMLKSELRRCVQYHFSRAVSSSDSIVSIRFDDFSPKKSLFYVFPNFFALRSKICVLNESLSEWTPIVYDRLNFEFCSEMKLFSMFLIGLKMLKTMLVPAFFGPKADTKYRLLSTKWIFETHHWPFDFEFKPLNMKHVWPAEQIFPKIVESPRKLTKKYGFQRIILKISWSKTSKKNARHVNDRDVDRM